jgi:hypothetical protein
MQAHSSVQVEGFGARCLQQQHCCRTEWLARRPPVGERAAPRLLLQRQLLAHALGLPFGRLPRLLQLLGGLGAQLRLPLGQPLRCRLQLLLVPVAGAGPTLGRQQRAAGALGPGRRRSLAQQPASAPCCPPAPLLPGGGLCQLQAPVAVRRQAQALRGQLLLQPLRNLPHLCTEPEARRRRRRHHQQPCAAGQSGSKAPRLRAARASLPLQQPRPPPHPARACAPHPGAPPARAARPGAAAPAQRPALAPVATTAGSWPAVALALIHQHSSSTAPTSEEHVGPSRTHAPAARRARAPAPAPACAAPPAAAPRPPAP